MGLAMPTLFVLRLSPTRLRIVASLCCFLLTYTPYANGWNALGSSAYGLAKAAIHSQWRAPQNTDRPMPVWLGYNPQRQPARRGGVWTDQGVAALHRASAKIALERGTTSGPRV